MWIETEMLEQEVKKLKAQMWKINKTAKVKEKGNKASGNLRNDY